MEVNEQSAAKASRDVMDLGKTTGQSPGNESAEHAVGLVDVDEMARILCVHKDWLYERTRKKPSRIPCVRVGRHLRFEPLVVLSFVKENGASL